VSVSVLPRARRAILAWAVGATFLLTLSAPIAPVSAHVNRVVGPYTILVILVEEPFFVSNHAGFQFWVHRGDMAVSGLEKTLSAEATGHGVTESLRIAPPNATGFYQVDVQTSGAAFDPKGGGAWSLRLFGVIERTRVDEAFKTTFPGYPRTTSGGTAPQHPSASPTPTSGFPVPLGLAGLAVVVAAIAGVLVATRRRRAKQSLAEPAMRTPAASRESR
jgi:hypothetical protein